MGAFSAATFVILLISSPSFAFAQVATTTDTTATTTLVVTAVATSSSSSAPAPVAEVISAPVLPNSAEVKAAVEAYFADIPVMINIAKCESNFTQYVDGHTLNGGSGGMMGVFQINRAVHLAYSIKIGHDINTLAGNMEYARHLYNTQGGTDPWYSSEGCWGDMPLPQVSQTAAIVAAANAASQAAAKTASKVVSAVTNAVTPAVAQASTQPTAQTTTTGNPSNSSGQGTAVGGTITTNLKAGMIHPQVQYLQQILNAANFTITTDGPGSPGQETQKFGAFTRAAVQKFQCAKGIVCDGSEGTTGYGYVGPKTRAALAQAIAIR